MRSANSDRAATEQTPVRWLRQWRTQAEEVTHRASVRGSGYA